MESTELQNEEPGRRDFLKQSALTGLVFAARPLISLTSSAISSDIDAPEAKLPWYNTVNRWGQINITEKDPPQYDISWWRQFWKRTQTEGVVVNAGRMVAYYPTLIPLHRKAEYPQGRNLFGELCRAAHDEGIVVFARMDSNRAHEEFYKVHPDWFAIDVNGKPNKAADFFITCVNSPYYQKAP